MAEEKDKSSWFSKFTSFLLYMLGFGVALFVASYFLASWFTYGEFRFEWGLLSDPTFYGIFGIAFLVVLLIMLLNLSDGKGLFGGSGGGGGGAKVKTKGKVSKYYDTNWLTVEQLKKDPQFKYHTFDQLSRSDNIGIPIRAELVGKKLEVNMYKSIHTLVIGTTGSGKTTHLLIQPFRFFVKVMQNLVLLLQTLKVKFMTFILRNLEIEVITF